MAIQYAPTLNPDVVKIAQEENVTLKRAYALLKERRMADAPPVARTHRDEILTALANGAGHIRTSNELQNAVRRRGSTLDGHDLVKALWAMQKGRLVKFRERGDGLYAIQLLTDGWEAYHNIQRAKYAEASTTQPEPEPAPEPEPEEVNPVAGMVNLSASFPCINDLVNRHSKNRVLLEAAKLLEEAGEDELAVNLYDKTKATELEMEIVELVTMLDQIGMVNQ